jgi:hypothetical protein
MHMHLLLAQRGLLPVLRASTITASCTASSHCTPLFSLHLVSAALRLSCTSQTEGGGAPVAQRPPPQCSRPSYPHHLQSSVPRRNPAEGGRKTLSSFTQVQEGFEWQDSHDYLRQRGMRVEEARGFWRAVRKWSPAKDAWMLCSCPSSQTQKYTIGIAIIHTHTHTHTCVNTCNCKHTHIHKHKHTHIHTRV